jgi:hypothetical protein
MLEKQYFPLQIIETVLNSADCNWRHLIVNNRRIWKYFPLDPTIISGDRYVINVSASRTFLCAIFRGILP